MNPMWKLEPAGKPVKVASSSGANCVLTQAGEIECNGYGTGLGRGELDDSYTLYTVGHHSFLGSYEFAPIIKSGPFVDIWAGGTSDLCSPSRRHHLVLGRYLYGYGATHDGRPKLRLGTSPTPDSSRLVYPYRRSFITLTP